MRVRSAAAAGDHAAHCRPDIARKSERPRPRGRGAEGRSHAGKRPIVRPTPTLPRSCRTEVDRSLTCRRATRERVADHLTAVETLENVVLRLVPNAATVAMIATAMPAASRPYSIAVAPCSSVRKFQSKL